MIKLLLWGMCFLTAILPNEVEEDRKEIIICVYDEKRNPIQGAVFVLYKGEKILEELSSNQLGEMKIKDLSEGKYELYQKTSAYGYRKIDDPFIFKVDKKSLNQKWEIQNSRILGNITLRLDISDPSIQKARLKDEAGSIIKMLSLTNDHIKIEQLPVGTYYVEFLTDANNTIRNTLFFDITPYNFDSNYTLTLYQYEKKSTEEYSFAIAFITIFTIGGICLIIMVRKKELLKEFRDE